MLHVDDGQLHAYADGELEAVSPGGTADLEAHLEACAQCRTRLDQVRQLRDRAGAILHLAEPTALVAPPFDVLAGKASGRPPVGARPGASQRHRRVLENRGASLAWAASLALAAGIGWLAREAQHRTSPTTAAVQMETVASSEPLVLSAEADQSTMASRPTPARSLAARSTVAAEAMEEGELSEASSSVAQSSAPGDAAPARRELAVTAQAAASEPPVAPASTLMSPTPAEQRNTVVHGRITTTDGQTVPAASVSIPSLSNGTVTGPSARATRAPVQPRTLETSWAPNRSTERATRTASEPGIGGRCSLAPLPHFRDPGAVYFTGIATPDTVLAGAGPTDYTADPDQKRRPVFGQRMRIQRVAGAGAEVAEARFAEQGQREVIVVPWGVDPACRPTPWTGSAQWIETGRPGFFRARLREREHWVAGTPTLDAFMTDLQPYPLGSFFREAAARSGGQLLTADEFFSLYSALPTWEQLVADPVHSMRHLRHWEQAQPSLAERYPASEILPLVRAARERVTGEI